MIHDRLTNEISVTPDLWATSILPEGILERWIFADGSPIEAGDPIAMVRVESALHEILAPAKGRLHIRCKANSLVEPGSVIGHISRDI
jgi:pyruvate/2-oxoglutarate dehydrogenase complex dihydrolipoamide acyltransferase (E2) component